MMIGASAATIAAAANAGSFDIPGGDLKSALDSYAQQTGVSLVVSETALKGVQTRGVRGLLSQVGETYAQYDRDLTLGSRSLTISSQELLLANERIRNEARAQQRVLASLRKAVQRLALGAGMPEVTDDDVHLEELSTRLWQLVSEHAAAKARLQTSEERLNLALTASDTWIWDWDRGRGTLRGRRLAPSFAPVGRPGRKIAEKGHRQHGGSTAPSRGARGRNHAAHGNARTRGHSEHRDASLVT